MSVAAATSDRPASGVGQPMPPAPPATIHETGLHPDTLAQLMLKTLVNGEATGTGLAEAMRLPCSVLDALIQHARVEKLVEVRGATGTGTAAYLLRRSRISAASARCSSSNCPAMSDRPRCRWRTTTRTCAPAWRPARSSIATASRGDSRSSSSTRRCSTQLGPAVNSGKSLFLYGAPGNGKTVLAEGIGRALGTEMYVPHAIDVDGQTVTAFDPVNHVPLGARRAANSVIVTASHDRRWERIRRPLVVVGGELTLEMLDLTFNPIARFYEAPIQMKANGGVFVVDDFGRQRIAPRDLLNRWIVPLESRVDFLTCTPAASSRSRSTY